MSNDRVVFPRLTFVVATKDSSRTIAACISALASQGDDVEVIVVDNNSTDGTQRLASSSGATRLIVGGPERSAQRNAGLVAARGSTVCFIDSDQIAEPGVGEQILTVMDSRPEVGAIVIPERSFGAGYLARCRDLEKRLIEGDLHAEAARAFRTKALTDVGAFRLENTGFEDYELHDRVLDAGWTVDRTRARVWHDEGVVRPLALLRKKMYYGASLGDFVQTRKRKTASRLVRPGFLRVRELRADPIAVPGLLFLKVIDVVGVLIGAIRAYGRQRG